MNLKKKILVLGSTGMLGHQVVKYLNGFDEFIVDDIAYRNKLRKGTIIVDAMDKTALERIIVRLKPDFIINCIGILVNGSQNEKRAIYLNAYLPHQLKTIAKNINSKLIHISTDCVFSGSRGQYIETDSRDGQGIYSQTKILGEIIDDTNLTLRTSIIGPELKNNGDGLFHWFMNQSGDISGYTKTIWSGVTTIELAQIIKLTIDNNLTGLYHITNNKSICKYELLKLFQKYTNKEINIYPTDGSINNKSIIDTRKLINYEIPFYEIMVKEMVENMKSNKSLYPYKNI
jgi:dTDP-4-dehydrorhamnose reductase